MTTYPQLSARSLLLAPVAALLVACGGEPASAPVALTQGRLSGASASTGHVAIAVPVTPGVATLNDVWVLSPDVSTLYKLRIDGTARGSAAVTGHVFALDAATAAQAVSGATYSVSGAGAPLLSLNSLPAVGALNALSLQHSGDAMTTALTADQAAGAWQAGQGDDLVVDWTIDGLALSGSSTSGCSYSGALSLVTGMGVYRVAFTETCGESVLQMSGVATLTADGRGLNVVATDAAEAVATALLFDMSER